MTVVFCSSFNLNITHIHSENASRRKILPSFTSLHFTHSSLCYVTLNLILCCAALKMIDSYFFAIRFTPSLFCHRLVFRRIYFSYLMRYFRDDNFLCPLTSCLYKHCSMFNVHCSLNNIRCS